MKKAQFYGQIFIYVLTLFVVAFILVYGYSTIMDFVTKSDDVILIQLRTRMTSLVSKMSTEYGSVDRRNDLIVPSKYKEVCFVDTKTITACTTGNPNCFRLLPADRNRYPIMENSIKDGTMKNMFLIKEMTDVSYFIGNITVTNPTNPQYKYFCIPVRQGRIQVQLEGTGSNTKISTYCFILATKGTVVLILATRCSVPTTSSRTSILPPETWILAT